MRNKKSLNICHLSLIAVIVLAVAEVLLVFASWLLSATSADGVRSLLSSEGIRFFFGSFVSFMQSPLLVWMLLLSMGWGALRGSGLLQASLPAARQRRALLLVLVVLMLLAGVVALLTALPHAVLLSATGRLWPSPFSRALVPIVAFAAVVASAVYGFSTRRFASLAQFWQALTGGIAACAPLLLLYVLAMQLYASLRFVFL